MQIQRWQPSKRYHLFTSDRGWIVDLTTDKIAELIIDYRLVNLISKVTGSAFDFISLVGEIEECNRANDLHC